MKEFATLKLYLNVRRCLNNLIFKLPKIVNGATIWPISVRLCQLYYYIELQTISFL